jgi:hypothetical protein
LLWKAFAHIFSRIANFGPIPRQDVKDESLLAALWRPFRAAIVVVGHLCLGAVVAVGIRGTEWLFQLLWPGEQPVFFDWVPIRWFFDASEALILVVFVVFGTWEAIEMLRR